MIRLIEGGGETSAKVNPQLKLIKGSKGMIQLTNMIYRDNNFGAAFMKLSQAELNHKAFYTVNYIFNKFRQRGIEVSDEAKKITEEYFKEITVTDEEGKESKKREWADQEAANAKLKELYERPLEIEASPLFTVDVSDLKFTMDEWNALKPIIGDFDNLGKRV